jgi:hypothetical protein
MTCYKDRTYCNSWCDKECEDKLTPEIAREAHKSGLLLSTCGNLCGKEGEAE